MGKVELLSDGFFTRYGAEKERRKFAEAGYTNLEIRHAGFEDFYSVWGSCP